MSKSATSDTYLEFADQAEHVLRKHILGVWFPRCVDDVHGGFACNFARDWKPEPRSEGKFSVFQARMTWISSQVVINRSDLKAQFEPYVAHGVKFLRDVQWDQQDGGFYWLLGDDGKPTQQSGDVKGLYGISFCIYGAAAAYEATKDPAALKLAQDGFRWADEHAHDATNLGYFEWTDRAGNVLQPDSASSRRGATSGFPVGQKSMNTHIHLLEAFTELYRVWPDPTLRARLEEMLHVVRDKVCAEPGAMYMFFTPQWKPTSDRDSYGHDIETAFLLIEASEALGGHDDAQTLKMSKMLVDHVLEFGWDPQYHGIYDEGVIWGKADRLGKDWWPQFEALNSLLIMHEKYGNDDPKYFQRFEEQWALIRDHFVDNEFGGIYEAVERDGKPAKNYVKARMWKAAYHDGRALINVTRRLREIASQPSGQTNESTDQR